MKEEFKEEIEDEGRRASRIGTNIGQKLTIGLSKSHLVYHNLNFDIFAVA